MFAEISVHSNASIDAKHFFEHVPQNGTPEEAIKKTKLAATPEVSKGIIYCNLKGSSVALVFADGRNGLEVHVENHLDNGSITKLKDSASRVCQLLQDQAKAKKIKFDKMSVGIYGEDNLVQTAEPVKFWDYLRKQIFEKILSTFLISLFAGIVTFITASEPLSGFLVFLATLAALLLRIALEAFNFKGEFIYEDT